MSKFLDSIKAEFFMKDDRRWVRLLSHFDYEYSDKETIRAPERFESDGASIPEFAWSIIGHPFDKYLESAIIHDYLYRLGIGTKSHADKVFLQGLKDQKINIAKRRLMYWMVCMFGKGSFED